MHASFPSWGLLKQDGGHQWGYFSSSAWPHFHQVCCLRPSAQCPRLFWANSWPYVPAFVFKHFSLPICCPGIRCNASVQLGEALAGPCFEFPIIFSTLFSFLRPKNIGGRNFIFWLTVVLSSDSMVLQLNNQPPSIQPVDTGGLLWARHWCYHVS